ncbi:MAG: siphovirus ReqiPepy6 Gp37-like family protein, partial [Coriobacteriia bacterium]
MSTPYRIYVRNASRQKIGEVDDYTLFDAVPRFNAVGHFILTVPADGAAAGLLDWGCGIIFEQGTTVIQSGQIASRRFAWNKDEFCLQVGGLDDNVWIEDKLALPVPSGPPYTAESDVRSGVAETVMRAYVNANCGPGATSARLVAGLALAADGLRGSVVTGRARFAPLGDLMRTLALAGGDLGWRIIQSGSGLSFEVYQPTDRTALVKFSPDLGNLRSYEYSEEASEANYVYCGGSGEGTLRVIAENGDDAAIAHYGRRIEMFRDRRDTSDAGELAQTISEDLQQRAAVKELRIEPVNTEAVTFLRDYFLGDKVTLVTHGGTIEDKVREVRIRLSGQSGVEIEPSVLSPGRSSLLTDPFAGLFEQVRRLKSRLGQL